VSRRMDHDTPVSAPSRASTRPDTSTHGVFGLLAPVLGTGVLVGGALHAGMILGPRVDGHGGEVGAMIVAAGIGGCAALLAWRWWAVAPGRAAIGAAAITAALSVPAILLFTALIAATPIESVVCSDSPDDTWCGLGVLFSIPVVGAVVPWTLAGIPGMFIVRSRYRKPLRSSP
jgi:hypothetical protein